MTCGEQFAALYGMRNEIYILVDILVWEICYSKHTHRDFNLLEMID